jgi:hypothetical protein
MSQLKNKAAPKPGNTQSYLDTEMERNTSGNSKRRFNKTPKQRFVKQTTYMQVGPVLLVSPPIVRTKPTDLPPTMEERVPKVRYNKQPQPLPYHRKVLSDTKSHPLPRQDPLVADHLVLQPDGTTIPRPSEKPSYSFSPRCGISNLPPRLRKKDQDWWKDDTPYVSFAPIPVFPPDLPSASAPPDPVIPFEDEVFPQPSDIWEDDIEDNDFLEEQAELLDYEMEKFEESIQNSPVFTRLNAERKIRPISAKFHNRYSAIHFAPAQSGHGKTTVVGTVAKTEKPSPEITMWEAIKKFVRRQSLNGPLLLLTHGFVFAHDPRDIVQLTRQRAAKLAGRRLVTFGFSDTSFLTLIKNPTWDSVLYTNEIVPELPIICRNDHGDAQHFCPAFFCEHMITECEPNVSISCQLHPESYYKMILGEKNACAL